MKAGQRWPIVKVTIRFRNAAGSSLTLLGSD